MSRLKEKVVLLTGATGGIGEACAQRFLDEGARVMLVGRSTDKLAATCSKLAAGDRVHSFACDATDEAGVQASVQATTDAFGGIDILLANAGTEGPVKLIETLTMDEFESIMRVNVTGVWLVMKHCITAMKQHNGGSIIAVSSIAGLVGMPATAAYSASKHAITGLVKSAALELAEAGIRVNAIAPGLVDNRMMKSLLEQANPEDPSVQRSEAEAMVPMKRFATNEEVANLALFLASDESSYCTGSIHLADGGYTTG